MSYICKKVLKKLLMSEELCDFVIRVRDGDYKIHRIVLCSCSSYFRNLFCSSPEMNVYSFPNVSASIMGLIVEYAYTRSLPVTENNVQELLDAAEYFSIHGIVQLCCNFLQQKLCTNNCINILTLADHYIYPDLWHKAYLFILRYFEEVAQLCPEFCQLSADQLEYFIEKDELNVRQESVVFEAILRWINYSPEERQGHLATLMSKVRLIFMSFDYLVDTVRQDTMVRSNSDCMSMVTNTIRALHESNLERPLSGSRLPFEVLLAVGGYNDDLPADKIELYNVRTDTWRTVYNNDDPLPDFSHCVYFDGFIYCVGGRLGDLYVSSVTKFDLSSLTWQEAGSMHEARAHLSVVALNGYIYALGGWNEHHTLNSAEQFQPSTNQWSFIAPMQHRRADAGAATLHGKVYIFGGSIVHQALSSAECYNPATNQWTLITPMEVARGAMGAIAYKDQIFVMGGYNDVRRLATVEAYDPVSMRWRMAAPMIHCCSNFGVALLENQLYVVGGIETEDLELCSNVWRYDGDKNEWHVVRGLEAPRGAISCCVVERIPHAAAAFS